MKIEKQIEKFISWNKDKDSFKDSLQLFHVNYEIVNTKYLKIAFFIIMTSVIYGLFSLQQSEVVEISFITIKDPFLVHLLFSPIYLLLIIKLITIESKMMVLIKIIQNLHIHNLDFPASEDGTSTILNQVFPYNFFQEINQFLISKSTSKFEIFGLLPIFLLYLTPFFFIFLGWYQLFNYIETNLALVCVSYVLSIWFVISLIIQTRKLISNIDLSMEDNVSTL